jgi:hypothetical protein
VVADTTGGTVAQAARLTGLINRFKTEEGAWYDDVLIAEMIELAKQTGDLTRNPVALKDMTFAQGNFWTGHFGGLYIFREVEHPAAICTGPKDKLEPLPVPLIALTERTAIARFLQVNDLVEPIVEARGLDAASILHQKMDFIVAEVAATMGEDLSGATRRDMRGIARKYARLLPEEWQGLAALARWAEEGGPWPRITSEHPAFFYSLRAKPRGDADLVNMLLSELSPLDVRQLFICHKEAFYRAYAGWEAKKQAYVADFLHREYMVDKAGVWQSLYGSAPPPLSVPPPLPGPWESAKRREERIVDIVGPWGAVTRKGR